MYKTAIKNIIFISLVCLWGFFSDTSGALAAETNPGGCVFQSMEQGQLLVGQKITTGEVVTKENCCDLAAKELGKVLTKCNVFDAGGTGAVNGGAGGTADPKTQNQIKTGAVSSAFLNIFTGAVGEAFQQLLFAILQFFGWMLAVAGALFAWVVDPNVMSGETGLFNKAAVRDIWIMVRDFLNLFFILVLLFSAFSTIFQVGKYHINKIWLNVLLNALLVNFSFPIARLVIDLSNVIMYYFLNNMFTGIASKSGAAIFANIADYSSLASVLTPKDYASAGNTYLIASIIFVFILAITLLVLAALFVVRLVMLTVLIMFSPIGFVGYIFPGSKGYADKWWSNLFKYAFFGPIMTFIMAVAIKIMETLKNDNMGQVIAQARNNSINAQQGSWMGEVAFFSIPIIILWIGMGYAQSAGIAGSGLVIGKAKKFANWAKGLPMSGIKGGSGFVYKQTGMKGAIDQKRAKLAKSGIFGIGGSDNLEDRTARMAQRLGIKDAVHDNVLKRANEYAKEAGLENMSTASIRSMLAGETSEPKRIAMLQELANKGAINETELKDVLGRYGANTAIGNKMLSKVKEKSPHLALAHMVDDTGAPDLKAQEKLVKNFKAENLNDKILADTNFMKMYVDAGRMDKKAIDGLSDPEKKTYGDTVNNMMSEISANHTADPTKPSPTDMNDKTVKNVQAQHLALKGELHTSLEQEFDTSGAPIHSQERIDARAAIFKKINKDFAGNLKTETVDMYKEEIAKNIDKGKAGEIIKAIPKEQDRRKLVREMWNNPQTRDIIKKDPYLNSLR